MISRTAGHLHYESTDSVQSHRITDDFDASDTTQQVITPQASSLYGQVATLPSDDAVVGDRFGCAVAISGDTAVVEASLDDE